MTDSTRSQYVYFIESIGHDAIKIGTAHDVYRRLAQLQTGNPNELLVRAIVLGDVDTEYHYHQRFADVRIRGEWFRYTGKIDRFLKRHAAGPIVPLDVIETGGPCVTCFTRKSIHETPFCWRHTPQDYHPDLPAENTDRSLVKTKIRRARFDKDPKSALVNMEERGMRQAAKVMAEQRKWHRERGERV